MQHNYIYSHNNIYKSNLAYFASLWVRST